MNDVLRISKKAFTWVTVAATMAWSMGVAAFIAPVTASAATLSDGDLIMAKTKPKDNAVYYYVGGKRYVFATSKTYFTWYTDFKAVKTITADELAAIKIGGNVTYKPGAKLVKIDSDPKVYAVDAGGVLRWVTSGDVAAAIYGSAWSKEVQDLPDWLFSSYKMGADVKVAADYNKAAVMAAAISIAVDMNVVSTAPPATPPVVTGPAGVLTVSAAAGNPTGSPTVITDAGNNAGGQRAKILGIRLASSGGDVKISTLKLRRTGVSVDGDLDNMYLLNTDGSILAQSSSVSKGLATFTKTGGLVTVPAAGLDLWLSVDLNKSAAAGETIAWKLDAADVTSDATSATGTAQSADARVVVVTDLGYVDVANVSPGAANSVDPQDGYDVWKFNLIANSQDMLVSKLKFTNVGSSNDSDLQNFSLWLSGAKLGEGVQQTNKTVTFDLKGLTDGGLKILSGQTKQLSLRADIKGGTNRTFRFTVQDTNDVYAKDLNYGVSTVPSATSNAAWTVVQAGGATTVNTGTLTLTIASDSPSGNIPVSATNVLIAKWNARSAGEPVKVTTMNTTCSSSDTTNILKNVKLLLNGSQVGSTMSTLTCNGSTNGTGSGTSYSFGNSFVVEAGKTATLELRADLNDSTIASGETISASLVAGSSNGQGTASLTAISTSAVSGRVTTVASGSLVMSKNAALANYTVSRPMGVLGQPNTRLASFVITGGAEPSDLSQVVIKDDVATSSDSITLADYFNNMRLMRGSLQIGQNVSSLTDTDATTYTFNLSPSVVIGIGETYVIDVYADLLSTAGAAVSGVNSTDTDGLVIMDQAVATGTVTSATTSDTATDPLGQVGYIATNGSLRVTAAGDTPIGQGLVLGSTDQVFAKFKLSEESNAEDILVKKFMVADGISINTAAPFNSTGTVRNFKLYNGAALLGTVASLNSAKNSAYPQAIFDLTGLAGGGLIVTKGQSMTVTVKADLTPALEGGSSSSTHRFAVYAVDADRTTTGTQNSVDAIGVGSGFSISTTNATATSGLVIGSATGSTTQSDANGSVMDALRTKISFSISDDATCAGYGGSCVSPSGTVLSSSAVQQQAIWKVSNTANAAGQGAVLKNLNLSINQSGLSTINSSTAALRVYHSNDPVGKLLATSAIGSENIANTQFADADFTDLTIDPGASMYLYIDLNMGNLTVAANDSLSIGIQTGGVGGQNPVLWSDGAMLTLTKVDGLPLVGRTLKN